jgi:hypothetical protein
MSDFLKWASEATAQQAEQRVEKNTSSARAVGRPYPVEPSASSPHRRNQRASVARGGGGGDEDYRSGDSRSEEREGRQIRPR